MVLALCGTATFPVTLPVYHLMKHFHITSYLIVQFTLEPDTGTGARHKTHRMGGFKVAVGGSWQLKIDSGSQDCQQGATDFDNKIKAEEKSRKSNVWRNRYKQRK